MPPATTRQDFLGKSVPSRSLRDQIEKDFKGPGVVIYDSFINTGAAMEDAYQNVVEIFSGEKPSIPVPRIDAIGSAIRGEKPSITVPRTDATGGFVQDLVRGAISGQPSAESGARGELRPTGVPPGLLDANPLGDPRFQDFERGRDDRVPLFQGPQNAQPEGFTGQSGAGPAALFGGAPGQPAGPQFPATAQAITAATDDREVQVFTSDGRNILVPLSQAPADARAVGPYVGADPNFNPGFDHEAEKARLRQAGREYLADRGAPPLPVPRPGVLGATPGASVGATPGPLAPNGPLTQYPDLANPVQSGGGGFSLPEDIISRLADSNIFGSLGVGMRTPGFLNGAAKATQLMAATRQKNRTQDIAQGAVDARSAATAATSATAAAGITSRENVAEEGRASREGIAEADRLSREKIARNKPSTIRSPDNYVSQDGTIAGTSSDGGLTLDTPQGRIPRPPGAFKVSDRDMARIVFEQRDMAKAKEEAAALRQGNAAPAADAAAAAERGSGIVANLAAGWNRIHGTLTGGSFGETNEEIQQSRRDVRLINKRVMSALMLSSRAPVTEQKWLKKDILPNVDNLTSNPASEKAKFDTLRAFITQRQEQVLDQLGNRMDEATRSKLRQAARELGAILEEIGGPAQGAINTTDSGVQWRAKQ